MNKVKSLADFHLPRWQQLPSMPLYLEQVLALLEEWLGPYLGKEDGTILTKTMINNYVKLHFVQPPIRRKYDRLTVASLFVIAVLKPVYTIEEIGYLIRLSLGHSDPKAAYDDFCDCAEPCLSSDYHGKRHKSRRPAPASLERLQRLRVPAVCKTNLFGRRDGAPRGGIMPQVPAQKRAASTPRLQTESYTGWRRSRPWPGAARGYPAR